MSPVFVLGRNEGERLLRNPAIWLSFVVTLLWVRSARRVGQAEDQLFLMVGYGLMLPGFVMVTAVLLATLRSRLQHSDELLGTLAVGPDRRSLGHVASTFVCGAIGLVATGAIYVALAPSPSLGAWEASDSQVVIVPRPNIAQLLQGPMALLAVAAFVIAIVRWMPTWLVLLPLGFLVMVQGLFGGVFHGTPTSGQRWIFPLNTGVVHGPWRGCGELDIECDLPVSGFDTMTPWWHLGYLAALIAWFTAAAVLRHRRDRRAWLMFAGTLLIVVLCVAAQFVAADQFVVNS